MASPPSDPARPFEHIAFTLPYNMSEQPADAGLADGLSGAVPACEQREPPRGDTGD